MVCAVPVMTPLQVLISAARSALLNADGHEQLGLAIEQVLAQLEAAKSSLPLLKERRARIEQLVAQLLEHDIEPAPEPPPGEKES
jgi:hypothetical protein